MRKRACVVYGSSMYDGLAGWLVDSFLRVCLCVVCLLYARFIRVCACYFNSSYGIHLGAAVFQLYHIHTFPPFYIQSVCTTVTTTTLNYSARGELFETIARFYPHTQTYTYATMSIFFITRFHPNLSAIQIFR